MKALFYGGAIASLAGLALGMGMALPPEAQPSGADAQPLAQPAASDAAESVGYGSSLDGYPPAYVINAAYTGEPVYDPRQEAALYPAADVSYDEPAIDRVLKSSWTDTPEPSAAPQDVAAAGDTSQPPQAHEAQTRTYASIDAVLSAARDSPAGSAF